MAFQSPYTLFLYLAPLTLLICTSCFRPEHLPVENTAQFQAANIGERVDQVVRRVQEKRALASDVHAAWQVLHGVLAYGNAFEIETAQGNQSALRYLLEGGSLRGWELRPGDVFADGRQGLQTILNPGEYLGQGHADQWFAVLAQAGLGLDDSIVADGQEFTMRDLLVQTQHDVPFNAEQEWSWTLIGLTWYLPTTATWIAGDGNEWSVEQLVNHELNQALHTSACGGTHRLIGISMALAKRRTENGALNSVWRRADEYLRNVAEVAKQYQNTDGSFSSNYFSRTGVSADNAKRLATTGHTLEFLALTLTAEELRQPWVTRAASCLCDLLEDAEHLPLECGALYHAIHGLDVYRKRVVGS